MASMSALSPELILHLMLLCGQWAAQNKLYLSQVCRQWRGVALDNSKFWSTINVRSVDDLRLLGTFIERSGTATLRVRMERHACDLSAVDMKRLNLLADDVNEYLREQINPLTGNTSRLVSLHVYVSRVRPFEELLRGGIYFGVLESVTLESDASPADRSGRDHVLFINWLAPALRTMELTEVCPVEGWEDLLVQSPRLERVALHCRDLPTGEELAAVFNHLRNLKELVLVSESYDPEIEAPPTGWNVSNTLRAVDMRLHDFSLIEVLCEFASVVLPSLTVGPPRRGSIPDGLLPHFMHGLGRVVEFDIENGRNINIRDEHARERDLVVHHLDFCRWDAVDIGVDIWQYLCDRHGAATSVLSFTLTPSNWKSYATAFAAVPPGAQSELRLTRGLWLARVAD